MSVTFTHLPHNPPSQLSQSTPNMDTSKPLREKQTNNITPSNNEEKSLDKVLNDFPKIFESKEMSDKRREIIDEMSALTTQWIQSIDNSKSESYILPFGSYELNAHFESSDIDLLCIGPAHITRDMLFSDFVSAVLRKDSRVSNILVLRHAFVPLLKFTFSGIDLDLVYAQWNIETILPSNKHEQINIFSSDFVSNQETLYSLNGVRSTVTIQRLVPNKAIFEKSLRIIKFWAQQRAIYGNVMGFLGGISWTIMTARICIAHPHFTSCVDILREFFKAYSMFDYSYANIYLQKTECDYQRNKYSEIMPILTPAQPTMNCAYNVMDSTKELIVNELIRAMNVTRSNNTHSSINWKALFMKRSLLNSLEFERDYQNIFIRIQCISYDQNRKWTGFIESKLRNLVKKLNRELFDSTFFPYASSVYIHNICNFFIYGTYNADFDNHSNNFDAIDNALHMFQNQIDSSSVKFQCGHNCRLQLSLLNTAELSNLFVNSNSPQSLIYNLNHISNMHIANINNINANISYIHTNQSYQRQPIFPNLNPISKAADTDSNSDTSNTSTDVSNESNPIKYVIPAKHLSNIVTYPYPIPTFVAPQKYAYAYVIMPYANTAQMK